MARFTDVDVDEFNAATYEVEDRVEVVSQDAVAEGSEVLRGEVQKQHTNRRTGNLWRSIYAHVEGRWSLDGGSGGFEVRRNLGVLGFNRGRAGESFTGVVGVDEQTAPYARRIEFGYRGPDRLGRRFNQRAHPYMRPGIAAGAPKALRSEERRVGNGGGPRWQPY